MSPIYITEGDVKSMLDMRGAIRALEEMFRAQGYGKASNSPRQRANYWGGRLNMMSAGAESGRFALKAYAGTRAPTVFHVMLYDLDNGLLAIIEANALGQLRTGAATGVATDRLASKAATTVAIIGAGRQARTQLQAVAAVRNLREVKAFARDKERLKAFCESMSSTLNLPVLPAANAQTCVTGAEIIITATTSTSPVIEDGWLGADVHVNAIGANAANRMELEPCTFARANLIVTDDRDQARLEAGELIKLVAAGSASWDDVKELSQVICDDKAAPGGLTIFKSLGAALEDLAVASAVYDLAIKSGIDRRVRS